MEGVKILKDGKRLHLIFDEVSNSMEDLAVSMFNTIIEKTQLIENPLPLVSKAEFTCKETPKENAFKPKNIKSIKTDDENIQNINFNKMNSLSIIRFIKNKEPLVYKKYNKASNLFLNNLSKAELINLANIL